MPILPDFLRLLASNYAAAAAAEIAAGSDDEYAAYLLTLGARCLLATEEYQPDHWPRRGDPRLQVRLAL